MPSDIIILAKSKEPDPHLHPGIGIPLAVLKKELKVIQIALLLLHTQHPFKILLLYNLDSFLKNYHRYYHTNDLLSHDNADGL